MTQIRDPQTGRWVDVDEYINGLDPHGRPLQRPRTPPPAEIPPPPPDLVAIQGALVAAGVWICAALLAYLYVSGGTP